MLSAPFMTASIFTINASGKQKHPVSQQHGIQSTASNNESIHNIQILPSNNHLQFYNKKFDTNNMSFTTSPSDIFKNQVMTIKLDHTIVNDLNDKNKYITINNSNTTEHNTIRQFLESQKTPDNTKLSTKEFVSQLHNITKDNNNSANNSSANNRISIYEENIETMPFSKKYGTTLTTTSIVLVGAGATLASFTLGSNLQEEEEEEMRLDESTLIQNSTLEKSVEINPMPLMHTDSSSFNARDHITIQPQSTIDEQFEYSDSVNEDIDDFTNIKNISLAMNNSGMNDDNWQTQSERGPLNKQSSIGDRKTASTHDPHQYKDQDDIMNTNIDNDLPSQNYNGDDNNSQYTKSLDRFNQQSSTNNDRGPDRRAESMEGFGPSDNVFDEDNDEDNANIFDEIGEDDDNQGGA